MHSTFNSKLAAGIFLIVLALSFMLFGQTEPVRRQNPTPPSTAPQPQLPTSFPADLSITSLSGHCLCDLSDVDALYIESISVTAKNIAEPRTRARASTEGIIKVTYYDVVEAREKIITKTTPAIPLNQVLTIPVVEAPILAKKSKTIKIEIQPSGNIPDPTQSNNTMIITECAQLGGHLAQ